MNAPLPSFDDVTPVTDGLRHKIEAAVEHLLALLDAMDGDDDLEPTTHAGVDSGEPSGLHDECEPNEDAEPDQDGEPLLGWTTAMRQEGAKWQGIPPMSGLLASAVLDGEVGDDNGIADDGGIHFDDEEQHDREQPDHW